MGFYLTDFKREKDIDCLPLLSKHEVIINLGITFIICLTAIILCIIIGFTVIEHKKIEKRAECITQN
jgi:hypothetical protein